MMGEKPIHDPRLIEALEACRPGSDDLKDPALAMLATAIERDAEFAELYHRLQRTDAALAEAFVDVAVPAGLQERLLDGLSAKSGELEEEGTELPPEEPTQPRPEPDRPSAVGRRGSRRWWLAGVGTAVAAAAAVVLAIWPPWNGAQGPLQADRLAEALEYFRQDAGDGGRLLTQTPYPEKFPPSREIRPERYVNARWRRVDDFLGQEGVAYDLTVALPGGVTSRATLYVVRLQVAEVPASLPQDLAGATNSRSTGGVSVVAWQRGELLYVLAFEGEQATYDQIRNKPGGDLA